MRLVEYEQSVKELIKSDRTDPEIYNLLQGMALMFLQRKKACNTAKDAEDISFMLAGDIFMRVIEGEDFNYFLGLLEKIYRSYVTLYYVDNKTEYLTFDASVDTQRTVYGHSTTYEYACCANKMYLEEISSVVTKVMESSCKYRKGTPVYLNLQLSLMLSVLRGRLTTFHLQPEHEYYLKLLLVNFYSRVKEDGLGFADNLVKEM